MRVEWVIAGRYLFPRLKQLSVALISLLSLLVISLVVWLVLVFVSVTDGLERNWTSKIVALSSPLRISPTPAYFQSYDYLIDQYSGEFQSRTLSERMQRGGVAVLGPDDPPLPDDFPLPEIDRDGTPKDLVQELLRCIHEVAPTARPTAYELALAQFNLRLKSASERFLSGICFLNGVDTSHPTLSQLGLDPGEVSQLPTDGIFLPKQLQDNGAAVGDEGMVIYYGASLASVQEQRLPVKVVGFYDPGVIPIGSKLILTSKSLVSMIRTASQMGEEGETTGVQVWLEDPLEARGVKEKLVDLLQKEGLSSFWKVQTFYEYDFSKDLLEQLSSDKLLFSLLAILILLVACSNIISMLILLVNDKKKEIGILRALGASWQQILLIFCSCGFVLGVSSALLGTIAAYLTLQNLDLVVAFLSQIQGHNAFNALFFGDQLPNAMSERALGMVWIATSLLSLLSGALPAWKAAAMKPAAILRSE